MLSPLRPAHQLTWARRPNRKHSQTNSAFSAVAGRGLEAVQGSEPQGAVPAGMGAGGEVRG